MKKLIELSSRQMKEVKGGAWNQDNLGPWDKRFHIDEPDGFGGGGDGYGQPPYICYAVTLGEVTIPHSEVRCSNDGLCKFYFGEDAFCHNGIKY